MDQIRGVLAEMQEEEDHIRTLRSREMTDALQRTSRIVVAGNLLSALLLFVVFVLLFRALSERKRAQEAAERSEKLWSTTLSSIHPSSAPPPHDSAVAAVSIAPKRPRFMVRG